MSSEDSNPMTRRRALKCLAYGGAGTLFTLAGGVLLPVDLALAASDTTAGPSRGTPLFVQISDTHIGFNKDANPDVSGTLQRSIALINAMPDRPTMVIHTGDITHLSKPSEFDQAALLLSTLRVTELHTTPGEHDVADASASEYFDRYGKASGRRGYYSFDYQGVHFVALINVLNFRANNMASLGAEQLAWLRKDLERFPKTAPIVVFTHRPLFDLKPDWEWFTSDGDRVMSALAAYENVTVLYGHIHREHVHAEGNATHYASRSLIFAFPDPETGAPKKPIAFDASKPFQNLGLRRVAERPPARPDVQQVELTLHEYAGTVGIQQILKEGEES